MLLWAGWILIALGLAALPLDRRIAHFLYDHVSQETHKRLNGITHMAKAGHWLGAAILALVLVAAAYVPFLGSLLFLLVWILGLGAYILYGWRTRNEPYVIASPPPAPV